jgi:hypothetical protein
MALLLRLILGGAGAAGGLLLVLATGATVIKISIGGVGGPATAGGLDTALSGADRHGPALIVIAVFAMVVLVAAIQGIRVAMVAVAACGVLVLGIAILSDAHSIDDTGQLRQLYSEAIAGAGNGFYLETLGGALLLVCGGGLLVLSGGSERPARIRRAAQAPRRAPAPVEPPQAPQEGPAVQDWFSD